MCDLLVHLPGMYFLKQAAGWKTISLDSKDLRTQLNPNGVLATECLREGLFVQWLWGLWGCFSLRIMKDYEFKLIIFLKQII